MTALLAFTGLGAGAAAAHGGPTRAHPVRIVEMPASGPTRAFMRDLSTRLVVPVFFAPGRAELTPRARRIVASALRAAAHGEAVALVVAQPAGAARSVRAAKLWQARARAVRAAMAHREGGALRIGARTEAGIVPASWTVGD